MVYRRLACLIITCFAATSSSMSRSGLIKPAARYLLRFDGGARGNPGLGGAGAVIFEKKDKGGFDGGEKDDEGPVNELWSGFWYLGTCTNNQAEYTGLIKGLQAGLEMELFPLRVEGDSELVIKQVTGAYKCKSDKLIPLNQMASNLIAKFPKDGTGTLSFGHVPRARNSRADELSNMAMDSRESSDGSSEKDDL